MAAGLSRANLNSATLVRILAELAVPAANLGSAAGAADPKATLAERLGAWLEWTDAIALSAALNHDAPAPPAHDGGPAAARALGEAVDRVRAELARSFSQDDKKDDRKDDRQSDRTAADADDPAAHRRRYQAHQRAMAARIEPLRARARAVLAARSPALGRLAALDATWEQALGERERHALSRLPGLLEVHFKRLRAAAAAPEAAAQDTNPAPLPRPTSDWIHTYCNDVRSVLLAELALRLQPVDGLVAALRNETTNRP